MPEQMIRASGGLRSILTPVFLRRTAADAAERPAEAGVVIHSYGIRDLAAGHGGGGKQKPGILHPFHMQVFEGCHSHLLPEQTGEVGGTDVTPFCQSLDL